jgi:mannosyltransferase
MRAAVNWPPPLYPYLQLSPALVEEPYLPKDHDDGAVASAPSKGSAVGLLVKHRLKVELLILGALVAVTMLLVLPGLGKQGLWLDEIYTTYMANQPGRVALAIFDRADVSAAAALLASQTSLAGVQYLKSPGLLAPAEILANPPLYYLIVSLFLHLGQGEFVTRLPSAIFGIASVPVMYVLGRRLFGTPEAIIGAFFLAVSQMAIWASTEARSYSLLMLLSLLNLLFFHEAVKEGRRRNWLLYLLTSLVLVNAHYYGFLVLILEGLFLVVWKAASLVGGRGEPLALRKIGGFALCLAAAIAFNPLSALVVSGVLTPSGLYQATLGWRYVFHSTFTVGGALLYARDLLVEFSGPGEFTARVFTVLFLLGIASFVAGRGRVQTALLTVLFVVPAASLLLSPTPDFRYIIFALPPFLLLCARGVTFLGRSLDRIAGMPAHAQRGRLRLTEVTCVAVLIVVSLMIVPNLQTFQVDEDWRGASQYITQTAAPGDVVIAEPFLTQMMVEYYVLHLAGQTAATPLFSFTSGHNVTFLYPSSTVPDIQNYTKSYHSVWVVISEKYLDITYVGQPALVGQINDSVTSAGLVSKAQFAGQIVVYHIEGNAS